MLFQLAFLSEEDYNKWFKSVQTGVVKMTEYEALRVLDKIPSETNIYRLLVELSERAHQTDRNRLNFRKTDPVNEAFREILENPENSGE